MASFS